MQEVTAIEGEDVEPPLVGATTQVCRGVKTVAMGLPAQPEAAKVCAMACVELHWALKKGPAGLAPAFARHTARGMVVLALG